MIPDANLLNALFRAFRGRQANQDELNKYVGTTSYTNMIISLDTGAERTATAQALATGVMATKDNWPQQIFTLQAQLKTAQDQIVTLDKSITDLNAKLLSAPTTGIDQATKDAITQNTVVATETNNIVKQIWAKITSIFK